MFAELEISVARTMPLNRLATIKDLIVEKIRSKFDDATITVTATPRTLDEETVLEKVLLAAAHRRVPVHHVTVQDLTDRLSVSLDLEVDGNATLGEAHQIASQLEDAIREELGSETEVETHIEPLVVSSLSGSDVIDERRNQVINALEKHAAGSGSISDVHSVRVRETEHGLIVNYHCRVDPAMNVASVHEAVDTLEHHVKQDIPAILRIVSHSEPLRP